MSSTTTTKDPPPPQQQPRPPPPPQFLLPHHHHHHHQLFPQLGYPLASSGRGLIPTHHRNVPQLPEPGSNYPLFQNPNLTSSRSHPSSTTSICSTIPNSQSVRHPFLNLPSSQGLVSMAMGSSAAQFSTVLHPLSKVGSPPYAVPESNAPKDLIEKKTDDSLVTIRDRKVRVSDGATLYALCRSWLRNGYPEDKQPQYGDALNSLPKPLPMPKSSSPKRKEHEDETNIYEVETDGDLNTEELLASHVKRAKKVRARLREERSRRIEKYKSRLALLLPPNGTIQE